MTDKLTREHRMTLDEAHLILSTKRADGMERILQVRRSEFGRGRSSEINATALVLVYGDQSYEHLFKANSPPEVAPTAAPGGTARGTPTPRHSHYLQSKVVRARERIEAEVKIGAEEPPSSAPRTPDPTAGAS
jgi:import inner membrane translocase subunit TIM16